MRPANDNPPPRWPSISAALADAFASPCARTRRLARAWLAVECGVAVAADSFAGAVA